MIGGRNNNKNFPDLWRKAQSSCDILQAMGEWNYIFNILNGTYYQPRDHYTEKLSFRLERGIRTFLDKPELAAFILNQSSKNDLKATYKISC